MALKLPRFEHSCPSCHAIFESRVNGGDHPLCLLCGTETFYLWRGTVTHGIQTDEKFIGGITIENLGHEPTVVYSRQELAQKMRAANVEQRVKYVPGDKHLTDWSKAIDPYTLAAATALVSRAGAVGDTHDPGPSIPVQISITPV